MILCTNHSLSAVMTSPYFSANAKSFGLFTSELTFHINFEAAAIIVSFIPVSSIYHAFSTPIPESNTNLDMDSLFLPDIKINCRLSISLFVFKRWISFTFLITLLGFLSASIVIGYLLFFTLLGALFFVTMFAVTPFITFLITIFGLTCTSTFLSHFNIIKSCLCWNFLLLQMDPHYFQPAAFCVVISCLLQMPVANYLQS